MATKAPPLPPPSDPPQASYRVHQSLGTPPSPSYHPSDPSSEGSFHFGHQATVATAPPLSPPPAPLRSSRCTRGARSARGRRGRRLTRPPRSPAARTASTDPSPTSGAAGPPPPFPRRTAGGGGVFEGGGMGCWGIVTNWPDERSPRHDAHQMSVSANGELIAVSPSHCYKSTPSTLPPMLNPRGGLRGGGLGGCEVEAVHPSCSTPSFSFQN